MADQWSGTPAAQLPQVTVRELSAFDEGDDKTQSLRPSRPTLKRSQKYTSSNSVFSRHKRARKDSARSSSADPLRRSPSFENAGFSHTLSARFDPPLEPSSIQHGISWKTSRAGQFIRRAWPLKSRATGSSSEKTTVVVPEHFRGRRVTVNFCPPSLRVTAHEFKHQVHQTLADAGMVHVPHEHPYSAGQPWRNVYTHPNSRYSRGRARAPVIPTGQEFYGNPIIPTAATNRDASVTEASRWCGLQPGTPNPSHTFSYFPAHPSNDNPLRPLTAIWPVRPNVSINVNNPPSGTRVMDSAYNSGRSSHRSSYEALSDQISGMKLPLSMPDKGQQNSESRSNVSETTTFVTSAEEQHGPVESTSPMETDEWLSDIDPSDVPLPLESASASLHRAPSVDSMSMNVDDLSHPDDLNSHPHISVNTNIPLFGQIPRSQPIDIPAVPERDARRASLRRVQSIEHLRHISISRQIFGPTNEGSRESSLERDMEGVEAAGGFADPMDLDD